MKVALQPAVESIRYKGKIKEWPRTGTKAWVFFDCKSVMYCVRLFKEKHKQQWLDFIMGTMLSSPLIISLGIPSKQVSVLCLKQWIEILLKNGRAIGCFKIPNDSTCHHPGTLIAVDIIYIRHQNDDIITRSFFSKDEKPFQNYIRLISFGHQLHRQQVANKNKENFTFLAALGLIIKPEDNVENIEEQMMKRRGRLASFESKQHVTSFATGIQNKGVKNKVLRVFHSKEEMSHECDVEFESDAAFPITYYSRNVPAADGKPEKPTRRTKAKSLCSQAHVTKEDSESEDYGKELSGRSLPEFCDEVKLDSPSLEDEEGPVSQNVHNNCIEDQISYEPNAKRYKKS